MSGNSAHCSQHSRMVTPVSSADTQSQSIQGGLDASALWQYLTIYLPHGTPLPDSRHVPQLLPFVRRRELPPRWKFQLAGGHPTVKTLCAVLVYLTGTNRLLPCDVCAGSEDSEATGAARIRPFPECIILPGAASTELKEYFGADACCNSFYQAVTGNGKRTHCVSQFSLSSSDLCGMRSPAGSALGDEEEVTAAKTPSPASDRGRLDEDNNSDSDSSGSGVSISLSLATLRDSPRYKTALPARVAGKPRMVSVRRAGRTTPTAKSKRQGSIRRLAARLGAKAARREVTVYKPSGKVFEEDEAANKQGTTTGSASTGKRRSRRLLEQRGPLSEDSKPDTARKASGGSSSSPSKPSKLRKKDNNSGLGASPDSSKLGRAVSDTTGVQIKASVGATPSLSLMMADWEIAPGRIRAGTGEDSESGHYYCYWIPQLLKSLLQRHAPCEECFIP